MLHEKYLPFTVEQLRSHFAPVHREGSNPDRHLTYYLNSIRRSKTGDTTKLAKQIEKDERFWVAASLMALYYSENRQAAFSELASRSGAAPPHELGSWEAALEGDLSLYFEVGLSSPSSYRADLLQHLDERAPIPYVREAAGRAGMRLEGPTKADAMLIAPETGAALLFEAKVLSDCSSRVTYDVLRNQLARNIDVMLERQGGLSEPLASRAPERSAFVLLTPKLFRDRPHTRLYGWLMEAYRSDPSALARDLPHRRRDLHHPRNELASVSERIGWATFEDCRRITPGACPWLSDSRPADSN